MNQIHTIFDLDEFKPLWSRWQARQKELARRHAYYSGEVYTRARHLLGWLYPRLQSSIRPLYLPLARAVNVDAGLVPGYWNLSEKAKDLQSAVDRVFGWSNWVTDGILYTHFGALYGSVGLRVADLRSQRRIVIRPVPPTAFILAHSSHYDATPVLALWIERLDNPLHLGSGGDSFEYAEVIENDRVRTFADGNPTGFDGRPAEYANELGFCPFVEVPHINVGDELGDCAFQTSVTLLDEVNAVATWLAEIIRKHADPQWAVIGTDGAQLDRGSDVARVFYRKRHTLNGLDGETETTFDELSDNLLAQGAAGHCCMQRAIDLAETSGQQAIATPNLAAVATRLLRAFRGKLAPRNIAVSRRFKETIA